MIYEARKTLISKSHLNRAILLILLGVVFNMVYSFMKTDTRIFSELNRLDFSYLLLALGLGLVPWLTKTLRNLIWTRFLGFRFSLSDILKIVIGMDLGSAVSPTAVGGGYVKMAMFIRKGLSPGTAASLMILGTIEDNCFFLLSVPFSLLWSSGLNDALDESITVVLKSIRSHLPWIFGAAVGMILLSGILHKAGITRKMMHTPFAVRLWRKAAVFLCDFKEVYRSIIKRGKYRFLLTLMLSGVQWTCRYSVISALFAGFHVPVHPVRFFFLQWIVFVFMTFTPTPGAMPGAEAGFLLVFRNIIPSDIIGLVTSGWRFLTFYVQLGLGLIVFSLMHTRFFSGDEIGVPRLVTASSRPSASPP